MLNHLIAVNAQSEKGFQRAARYIDNTNQKQFFLQKASQRQDFKYDIQAIVNSIGGEVETGNSISSDLYQGWLEMKTALLSASQERILKDIDRLEDRFFQEYARFLEHAPDLPALIREVVERHQSLASQTRLRVKEIEELLEEYA